MKPSFCKILDFSGRGQSGIVLVLFALTAFSLMVLGFGAIAFANAYRIQIQVQNAADAAVIGAMSIARSESPDDVKETARRIYVDNLLKVQKLLPGTFDDTPDLTAALIPNSNPPRVNELTIEGTAHPEMFVLDSLYGFAQLLQVKGTSTARLRPAAVTLVLDCSYSMTSPTAPDTVSKFVRMKEATTNFVNRFADGYDWFSVVTFSTDTQVSRPMGLLNRNAVDQFINNIPWPSFNNNGGMTNITSPMRAGRHQFDNPQIPSDAVRILVLLSDGAPTRSPSVQDQQLPENANALAPCQPNSFDPSDQFGLGEHPGNPALMLNAIVEADRARAAGVTVFAIGLGNNAEGFLSPDTNAPDPFQGWLITDNEWSSDMGGYDSDPRLRSTFMARLANSAKIELDLDHDGEPDSDLDINGDGVPDQGQPRNVPDFDQGCVPNFDDIMQLPQGQYYETPSSTQLGVFFQDIIGRIMVILTQ